MSQAGSSGIGGGGAVVLQLTGDTGVATAVANNINVLGNGAAAPASLANSGMFYTGTPGNLQTTIRYLNMPNTTAGGNGILYLNSVRFLHNYGNQTNTFVGGQVGNLTSSGTSNAAVGFQSMLALTSGDSNAALGAFALQGVTSGSANTSVGEASGGMTSGSFNTALGFNALTGIGTGNYNLAIGWRAGTAYAGNRLSNIAIANVGNSADNNTIRIGTTGTGNAQQNRCFLAGTNGVDPTGGVGTANVMVQSSITEQLGTSVITAGTGISITPTTNLITIAATGAGAFAWSVITANQTAAVNKGYFCNKAGTLTLALPATSAVGDVIEVNNINTATGTQFTQAAGQQIFIGSSSTTLGATGTLTSSAVGDSLKIVCSVANTTWRVTSGWGNWTPA